MRRGAHDYLLKPIRPDHLQLSLERLLAGRDQIRGQGCILWADTIPIRLS
jgi:response regulator of citrate/malate metabolism